MSNRHDTPLPQDVMQAISEGRKIEAIKLLREHTGMGLKEANDVVESVQRVGFGSTTQHRAAPRNDTGLGRLVLVFLVLGAVIAGYLLAQG